MRVFSFLSKNITQVTVLVFCSLSLLANAQNAAPYEIIEPTSEKAELIDQRLGVESERIWLDGDVLWIAKRSQETAWKVTGGVSTPLFQINETDIWAVGLSWDKWSRAFVKIAFYSGDFPTGPVEFINWSGDHAPNELRRAEPGQLHAIDIDGPTKDETRLITVVLPPEHDGSLIPALILADGQSAEEWGKVISFLVRVGKIRPIAVVGVHSGGYQGDRSQPYDSTLDLRAREYLEGFDQDRFDTHLDWIVESVLPEAARRFNISRERGDLAVAGFSNGGAFAASAALRRNDVFSMSLAMSIGIPPEIDPQTPDAPMSAFYFAAGELEPGFLQQTTTAYEQVLNAGGEAQIRSYVAGHDAEMWMTAMAEYLPMMFPPKADESKVLGSE